MCWYSLAVQYNYQKHKSDIVQSWVIWNCSHLLTSPAQLPNVNVFDTYIHKHEISDKKKSKDSGGMAKNHNRNYMKASLLNAKQGLLLRYIVIPILQGLHT